MYLLNMTGDHINKKSINQITPIERLTRLKASIFCYILADKMLTQYRCIKHQIYILYLPVFNTQLISYEICK